MFQQDGAPAHTATATQAYLGTALEAFWPKDYWPPSSPDCNPLDYSIWWHIESKACRRRHNSLISLKRAVNKAWRAMEKAYVVGACQAFRARLEKVVAAKGGCTDD